MITGNLLLLLFLLAVAPAGPTAQEEHPQSRPAARSSFDHAHRAFDRLLAEVVEDGRVDYRALERRRDELDAYLRGLEAVPPDALAEWSREQRMAFWINAYNGFTLQRVVERYPVQSIKDIGSAKESVWDQRFIRMPEHHPQGKRLKLSLNDIEHEILRKRFLDPRIHAVVNCAAESCPPLSSSAYTAEELERQLTERTRGWLANDELNRYDARAKTLKLSKIFSWFAEDFGGDEGVRRFVAEYGPPAVRDWAAEAKRVEYLEYDWALNEREERD